MVAEAGEAIGEGVTYVGGGELARMVKICHNVLLGVVTQSLAEITVLAEKGGFLRVHWAGSGEDEERVKEETKATIRCFPLDAEEGAGRCFYTGQETECIAIFARAY